LLSPQIDEKTEKNSNQKNVFEEKIGGERILNFFEGTGIENFSKDENIHNVNQESVVNFGNIDETSSNIRIHPDVQIHPDIRDPDGIIRNINYKESVVNFDKHLDRRTTPDKSYSKIKSMSEMLSSVPVPSPSM
jgi:hypothetical protein